MSEQQQHHHHHHHHHHHNKKRKKKHHHHHHHKSKHSKTKHKSKHSKKHKKHKKKHKKLSPVPPVALPSYYDTSKYLPISIEATTTTITSSPLLPQSPLSTNSASSIHSIRSPSIISSVSSSFMTPTILNQLFVASPKQSVVINDVFQREKEKEKEKKRQTPKFYRWQYIENDVSLNKNSNINDDDDDDDNKSYIEREEETEEIEYDYDIITDINGETYIDITIDINNLNNKPNLQFYNLPNIINEMVRSSSSDSYQSESSESSESSSSSSSLSLSLSSSSSSSNESTIYSSLRSVLSPKHSNDDDSKLMVDRLNRRQSIIEIREKSIQKHESILLEILKCTNRDSVISAIRDARCDVLCYFLPLIAFTLCQSDKLQWRLQLLHRLSDRIIGQSDLKQSVKFLLSSYNDITEVKAVFIGLLCDETTGDETTDDDDKIISFWSDIIGMKLSEGTSIIVPQNTVIRDPINPLRPPIGKIVISKIINSNSKPLLIDCYVSSPTYIPSYIPSSTFILKYGDDLRKDKACMLVFKWMNHLWTNKCKLNVHILTYKVIPISTKLGCIELISDCIPLRDILSLQSTTLSLKPQLIHNLIESAAGSYIASYIMGIRDRHFDNILIRKTDLQLFHIDMNYILGDTLKGIDANKFGITKELYDILNKHNYNIFIDLACKAFQCLRQYNEEFINFTCLAFSYVTDYKTIRSHILKQLRMAQSENNAKNWLKNTLIKAPFNVQTQIKNKIHKFATR